MNSSKALLTLFLATASLHAGDKATGKHQSTTVIQIHETVSPLEFGIVPSKNFFRNQVATLTTGSILNRAAAISKIDADKIKQSLTIKIIEGTDLVEITSTSNKATEPKNILNSLTEAYITVRSEREQKRSAEVLKPLETEVQRQHEVVLKSRKALSTFIGSYGIPYFDGKESKKSGNTDETMYRRAQEKFDQLERSKDQLKIQIRKLIETKNKDLIRTAAGLELPENQVTVYYTAYRTTEEQILAMMASGLGEKHPEIVATKRRSKQALDNAEKELVVLKEVLQTRLNLVEKQVERMKQMIAEKKDGTIDLSKRQHQYTQAKETYEQARTDLRQKTRKLEEARIKLKLPRHPITVHEQAK